MTPKDGEELELGDISKCDAYIRLMRGSECLAVTTAHPNSGFFTKTLQDWTNRVLADDTLRIVIAHQNY
jgi:hypothetical protein